MIIPTVGVFNVKARLAAVGFDNGLCKDSRIITNKNFSSLQRKRRANNFLTMKKMDQFNLSQSGYNVPRYEGRFMSIDKNA